MNKFFLVRTKRLHGYKYLFRHEWASNAGVPDFAVAVVKNAIESLLNGCLGPTIIGKYLDKVRSLSALPFTVAVSLEGVLKLHCHGHIFLCDLLYLRYS